MCVFVEPGRWILCDEEPFSLPVLLNPFVRRWLARHLPQPAVRAYARIARSADVSHGREHSHVHLARAAKSHVELDRSLSMSERGYTTLLTRLQQPQLHSFKSDLLLGVPQERMQQ
jgi:hypothetical protein